MLLKATPDMKDCVALPHHYRTVEGTAIPRVTSMIVPTSDMDVEMGVTASGHPIITGLNVGGVSTVATSRFVNSMCGLIGQSKSIFSLFSPDEVLQRVITSGTNKHERYNVQFVERVDGVLETVAVTSPDKKAISSDEIIDSLREHIDLNNVSYSDGSITTLHDPVQATNFMVGGDDMLARFVLQTPIDGYGSPTSHLAIFRHVCSNLMIGYNTVFKSNLKTGKGDQRVALNRFVSTLNNEEGFAAIENRMNAARETYASINEVLEVRRALDVDGFTMAHQDKFRAMIRGGDNERSLNETYGVANFAEHPAKRLRCLPSKCSVYDLMNFATEFGTHYVDKENDRRSVNCAVAGVLASKGGLDLEGVCTIKTPVAKPLWLNN